ncbi:MAG: pyroglutamyl-peptidase I [Defluviitaleaceae bacterium]|nr:pyroglutamyl-peptidase I [Defluviitaleaceae bacterium]
MNKKILIAGFEPFGGEVINPSLEAVMSLPSKICDIGIRKLSLPVVFGKSKDVLYNVLDTDEFDVFICVGQAGGKTSINIERIAINIDDTNSPDNEGFAPKDQPIYAEGPDAYFTTLPIKKIVANLMEEGIPAAVSNTAGTYVCNHIMYAGLHYASQKRFQMKVGFVHIPYLPSQVLSKNNIPSMHLDNIVAALVAIVKTTMDEC